MFAAKDYPGALEQLPLASKAAGDAGLSREGREVWARTLFVTNKFPESAAMYEALAKSFKDMPGYAYETAVVEVFKLATGRNPDSAAAVFEQAVRRRCVKCSVGLPGAVGRPEGGYLALIPAV